MLKLLRSSSPCPKEDELRSYFTKLRYPFLSNLVTDRDLLINHLIIFKMKIQVEKKPVVNKKRRSNAWDKVHAEIETARKANKVWEQWYTELKDVNEDLRIKLRQSEEKCKAVLDRLKATNAKQSIELEKTAFKDGFLEHMVQTGTEYAEEAICNYIDESHAQNSKIERLRAEIYELKTESGTLAKSACREDAR